MTRSALALLALVLCAPSWGALYKWVDKNGVTHYEETPPAGIKARELEVQSSPPPGGDRNAPAAKDWQEQEREFQKRRLDQKQAEDTRAKKEAAEKEAKRADCLRAQRNLNVLNMARPVFSVNEKGERVYIEDSARQAAIEEARKAVSSSCSP